MRMVADVEEEVGDAIEGTAARAQTACEAAGAGLIKRTLRRRRVQHHRAVEGGRVFEFRAELL